MDVAPPLLVVGRDVVVSTLAIPRLCVPLYTPLGEIALHLAITDRRSLRPGVHTGMSA